MHERQESPTVAYLTARNTPTYGWIAYDDEEQPIAAGFLRRVEGHAGQFDTFVSNPDMPSAMRHTALSKICENLLNDAKTLKLEGIISYTQDKTIIERAEAIGFSRLPHAVLALKLPSED